jgi:formylglycine-generating enzyme required for sulfatase activity
VWEWVEDCWHPNYQGAPADGSPWLADNCAIRVLRSGAWDYPASAMRAANRYYFSQTTRRSNYGFRLAISAKP